MFRRRLLGARPGTVFILQELYFRKRLPSRLYRARVRIKIHSRNWYQLYRNVNNTGYFSMLNLPTSDCGSKVNCKIPGKAFISFATRFLLSFTLFIILASYRKEKQSFLLPFSRIYQADEKTCKVCHEECDGSCIGPNTDHCKKCKHARDGPFCVPECPASKYNDNGVCKSCHGNCVGGCEGPENNIGPNGCHSCDKAILNDHVPEGCLQKKESCPDGR